jgi:hypothetical protein
MGENRFKQENEKNEMKLSDFIGLLAAILTTVGDGLAILAIEVALKEEQAENEKQQLEQEQQQLEMRKILERLERLESKLGSKN